MRLTNAQVKHVCDRLNTLAYRERAEFIKKLREVLVPPMTTQEELKDFLLDQVTDDPEGFVEFLMDSTTAEGFLKNTVRWEPFKGRHKAQVTAYIILHQQTEEYDSYSRVALELAKDDLLFKTDWKGYPHAFINSVMTDIRLWSKRAIRSLPSIPLVSSKDLKVS